MPDQLAQLRRALADAWQPPPRLSVSEVAERTLHLSSEYSAVAGTVRFDSHPYLREIIDRLHPDDPCRAVVFRGPIQAGKTIVGQAWLCDIITAHPGPTLWVTDTAEKAEVFSKKRLDLMVRDSPVLTELVADPKGRNASNTLKFKTFPGGDIKLVGAQSVTGLTSDTCRYAIIDEADDHRANVGGAGSSIVLAMNRQTTYGDQAKTLIVSSPKVKGDSEIDTWHDRGDRRVFEVPCPECGEYQPLEWRDPETGEYRLQWPKGQPELARYICRHCGCALMDADKNRMLPHGRWEPTTDEGDVTVTSYSLNALYLPVGSYSWPDMARQWESATTRLKAGDSEEHRTFCNTRLGESYQVPGDTLDTHALARRVEPAWSDDAIPDGVRVVSMGTDVQDDRLETLFIGWGLGWECWVLGYAVILLDPRDDEALRRHDALLRRKWTTESGRTVSVGVSCIDRGHLSQRVLEYTNRRRGVHAVKGTDGTPRDSIWDKKIRFGGKSRTRSAQWFSVRVVPAKDTIAAMLRVTQPGPRYVHIPTHVVEDHPDLLDMLTAERRVSPRDRKGRAKVAWLPVAAGRRNEALDCFVYALAGAHAMTLGGVSLESRRLPDGVDPGVHQAGQGEPKMANQPESQQEKPHSPATESQSETRNLTRRRRLSQAETRPGRSDPKRWFG
jgi:phage terminase large subunit GpA-like protein